MEEDIEDKKELKESDEIKKFLWDRIFRDEKLDNYMASQQPRTLYKKIAFIQNLEKANGIISIACKMTGIKSRKTIYNWMAADPNFLKIINEMNSIQNDEVFDVLVYQCLYKHDGPSVRYYLNKRHPDFMKPKRTTVPPKKGPQTIDELFEIIEAKDKLKEKGV